MEKPSTLASRLPSEVPEDEKVIHQAHVNVQPKEKKLDYRLVTGEDMLGMLLTKDYDADPDSG